MMRIFALLNVAAVATAQDCPVGAANCCSTDADCGDGQVCNQMECQDTPAESQQRHCEHTHGSPCTVSPGSDGRADFPESFQQAESRDEACMMKDDSELPDGLSDMDRAAIQATCADVAHGGNQSYHDACHDALYAIEGHGVLQPCRYEEEDPGCTIDGELGTITGNVEVHGETITELHLNHLSAIAGDLVISRSPHLSHIDFGTLTNVTRVEMEELAVSALEWSGLTRVCDHLKVEQMSALSSISFPNLVSVGDLIIEEVESLSSVELPALVSVGDDLKIEHMQSLRSVRFPQLVDVGDHLVVGFAPVLTSFVAPNLQSVGFFGLLDTPLYGAAEEMCGASCDDFSIASCELQSEEMFPYMYHHLNHHLWDGPPTDAATFDGLCSMDGAQCTDYNGESVGTYSDAEQRCASATTRDGCYDTPFCHENPGTAGCHATSWSEEQGCPLEVPSSVDVVFAQGLGAEPLPWPLSSGGSKDSSDSCYDGVMGVCSDAMALIDCTEAGQHVFAAAQFGDHGEHAAKWRGRVALCCALPTSIDCGPPAVRQMLAVCETMGVRNCTC